MGAPSRPQGFPQHLGALDLTTVTRDLDGPEFSVASRSHTTSRCGRALPGILPGTVAFGYPVGSLACTLRVSAVAACASWRRPHTVDCNPASSYCLLAAPGLRTRLDPLHFTRRPPKWHRCGHLLSRRRVSRDFTPNNHEQRRGADGAQHPRGQPSRCRRWRFLEPD